MKIQIIEGADILEVLHGYPELREFVLSLYNCQYDKFFRTLSEPVTQFHGVSILSLSLSLAGAGVSEGSLPSSSHAVLHPSDEDQGIHSAAGVLSLSVSLSHGRHLWGVSSLH